LREESGRLIKCKIGLRAKFSTLCDEYSQRKGLQAATLRFSCGGRKIFPHDTPDSLGMDFTVTIEVIQLRAALPDTLCLRVKDMYNEFSNFKVKQTTPFRRIFNAYADQRGVREGSLMFYLNSMRSSPYDTAEILGLKENDFFDVIQYEEPGEVGLYDKRAVTTLPDRSSVGIRNDPVDGVGGTCIAPFTPVSSGTSEPFISVPWMGSGRQGMGGIGGVTFSAGLGETVGPLPFDVVGVGAGPSGWTAQKPLVPRAGRDGQLPFSFGSDHAGQSPFLFGGQVAWKPFLPPEGSTAQDPLCAGRAEQKPFLFGAGGAGQSAFLFGAGQTARKLFLSPVGAGAEAPPNFGACCACG
jgi:hypothetical protein